MSISKEQAKHLAHLSALGMSEEELQEIRPQLEQIVEFVGQLENCNTDEIELAGDDISHHLSPRAGVQESIFADGIVDGIPQPVKERQVCLETSTNK